MADEITFKSAGTLATDDKYSGTVETVPIGIKTPLQFGLARSGIFDMNFEYADQINDNLKNLIMTNYGDRLGLYKFGANLRQLVSERTSKEEFDSEAMLNIQSAITAYMPFVEPTTFESVVEAVDPSKGLSSVTIKLMYNVEMLRLRDKQIEVVIHTME